MLYFLDYYCITCFVRTRKTIPHVLYWRRGTNTLWIYQFAVMWICARPGATWIFYSSIFWTLTRWSGIMKVAFFVSRRKSWENWMVVMNQFRKALWSGWDECLTWEFTKNNNSLHILLSVLLSVLCLKLFWINSFIYDIFLDWCFSECMLLRKVIRITQFQCLEQGLKILNRLPIACLRLVMRCVWFKVLRCLSGRNWFICVLSEPAFQSLMMKCTWN